MKKFIKSSIIVILIVLLNQLFYLTYLQYHCTEKIQNGKELNCYEVISALQTHSCFWLVGWIIEPNVAKMCFDKQFHVQSINYLPDLPKDDVVIKRAKQQLLSGQKDSVRLAWKNYTSSASILYNGSIISLHANEFGTFYKYTINADYKPGIINIAGVTLSETVFDYLENKGILSVFTDIRFQNIK